MRITEQFAADLVEANFTEEPNGDSVSVTMLRNDLHRLSVQMPVLKSYMDAAEKSPNLAARQHQLNEQLKKFEAAVRDLYSVLASVK